MIGFLRSISTRQLLAVCAAVVAIAGGGTALALAATDGGPTPPPKDLPVAIHDALAAPHVEGVTARVEFTNHLRTGSEKGSRGDFGVADVLMANLLTLPIAPDQLERPT